MRTEYHSHPAPHQVKTWSPGQPFDPTLRPIAASGLRDTCLRCGVRRRVERSFAIQLVEGGQAIVHVCTTCAALPVGRARREMGVTA